MVSKHGVQAPVVMHKAGSAFSHSEALDQVIMGEIFERESWIGSGRLSVWLVLEELKYVKERTNVGSGRHKTPGSRAGDQVSFRRARVDSSLNNTLFEVEVRL